MHSETTLDEKITGVQNNRFHTLDDNAMLGTLGDTKSPEKHKYFSICPECVGKSGPQKRILSRQGRDLREMGVQMVSDAWA